MCLFCVKRTFIVAISSLIFLLPVVVNVNLLNDY